MRICSKCKEFKNIECFGKRSVSRDGLCIHCKDCENLRYKIRYSNNKEKESVRKNNYYHQNKKLVREHQKRYYQNNKELISESRREYAQRNANKRRNWEHRRRARKLNQIGYVPDNIETILFTDQKGNCFYCEVSLRSSGFHLDHKTPLSIGGLHDWCNLCLACPTCNMSKHIKTAEQYMEDIRK